LASCRNGSESYTARRASRLILPAFGSVTLKEAKQKPGMETSH